MRDPHLSLICKAIHLSATLSDVTACFSQAYFLLFAPIKCADDLFVLQFGFVTKGVIALDPLCRIE